MHRFLIPLFVAFGGSIFVATTAEKTVYTDIDPFMMEGLINSTIEGIRPYIPDPLKIDDLNITIPDDLDLVKGSADVSNFELTGLKGFQVPALHFELLGMQLNFTFVFPSINLNTDYVGDLLVLDLLPLYGDGKANFHLTDLEIQGSGAADLDGGISIKNLRIQLYLGSATFDIHGALYNEEFSAILSQLLNDMVAPLLDDHQEAISNILSPILETIINAILAGANTDTTTAPPVTP